MERKVSLMKACPFCGRDNDLKIERYESDGKYWYYAECEECLAQGPVCADEEEALRAWNHRTFKDQDIPLRIIAQDSGRTV